MEKTKQQYEIGERVEASGWTRSDFGEVEAVDWIYHSRSYSYCWGYKIKFEGEGPGLAFTFIPEGYLRKIWMEYPKNLPEPNVEYEVKFEDNKEAELMYWSHDEGFDAQAEPHHIMVTHWRPILDDGRVQTEETKNMEDEFYDAASDILKGGEL